VFGSRRCRLTATLERDYDEARSLDKGGAAVIRRFAAGFHLRIGILGTGGVGAALGTRWGAAGHTIVYGSRAPASERVQQLVAKSGAGASATSPRDAIDGADAVLFAVPWPAAHETLAQLGDLSERVLIDCTNPLLSDLSGIELGHVISAGEQIAMWAPGAKIVKAFNTASVKVMLDPQFGDTKATMFYCGDDAGAKLTVRQFIEDVGFEPVDAGSLSSSRYLEPLAMLYIHLAFRQGFGSNCAFKIMRR
jgi:predicted dinucleotide-binding enzyme